MTKSLSQRRAWLESPSAGSETAEPMIDGQSLSVCVISGFSDIEVIGNQSMKNTITHLADFGHRVHVWSFFPQGFPNLIDSPNALSSNVMFHRLPRWSYPILAFGSWLKNTIASIGAHKRESKSGEVGEYYGDDNGFGRLVHVLFLVFVYVPLEGFRVGISNLSTPADIFYGLNWQGAVVASLLGKLFGRPVVTRFQGTSLTERNGLGLWDRIRALHEYIGLRSPSDAVVMTNDGTHGDRILKVLKVDSNKIFFWMNGFDIESLDLPHDWDAVQFKESLGLRDKQIVLAVSRLASWKRLDRSIRCMQKLVTKGVPDAVLLIIGDGPERSKLERLIKDLRLAGRVRLLGGIPHAAIAKYYAIADIFVTLYDLSNLGNPLLEAMSFGLPIVTLDDGSTSHLLNDGENACLVKLHAIDELLPLTLERLLADQELRRRLGEQACLTFKRKVLSWRERMLLEHELFQRLVAAKRASDKQRAN